MAAGSTFKQVEQNTAQNRRTQVLQSHYFHVYKHDFGIYLLLLLGTLACLSAFRHWQRSLNLRCGWRMLAPDPVLNWMLKKYVAMTASIQPKMRSVPSFFYDDGFKARNLHGRYNAQQQPCGGSPVFHGTVPLVAMKSVNWSEAIQKQ